MRLLLASFGTAGDVHPFLAIAKQASLAGHYADSIVPDRFIAIAERMSAKVYPLPERWSAQGSSDRASSLVAAMEREIFPLQSPLFHTVVNAIRYRRPDMVVAHHTALAAAWAAQTLEIPWVMAATAPASWPSFEQPVMIPGMPDKDQYRPWLLRPATRATTKIVSALSDTRLNRVRKKLGLAPGRNMLLDGMFEGVFNLGLWSPIFRSKASDDRPRSVICGFTWFDESETDPQALNHLRRFLDSGEQAILFTLGSRFSKHPGRFYDYALETCRLLGRRGILLTSSPGSKERGGILQLGFMPHSQVMPHAAAVVHQGGVGTTAQALRAGRPAVIVPQWADQFDNARRSRMLGASVTLSRRSLSPTVLAKTLERLLSDHAMKQKAEGIAQTLRAEDGAKAAVQALEKAVNGDRPD